MGSYPGQHAFASDEDFLAPSDFFALFLPGVFFVSAPVMCCRFAAVFVFADLVARFTDGGALFFAALFLADALFTVAFDAEPFELLFFALDFFVADFFAVAMLGLEQHHDGRVIRHATFCNGTNMCPPCF